MMKGPIPEIEDLRRILIERKLDLDGLAAIVGIPTERLRPWLFSKADPNPASRAMIRRGLARMKGAESARPIHRTPR